MASMQDDFARKLRHQQPARVDYSRPGFEVPRRLDRCDVPGCDWRNIYATSTDGSRELEAHEHALTHGDGAA